MNLENLPGLTLDGKYRLERQLGRGGMGAVFLARHIGTTRTVAVKIIVPQFAGDAGFLLRFQREAEAAGRLRHPNVVNVTDFGVSKSPDGDLAYLVMEYLDGRSLGDVMRAGERVPLPLALDIVDQVALGLDAAHRAGIVHRDLKPDNVWLEDNGRGGYYVKVLDFGIAKIKDPLAVELPLTPGALAAPRPAGGTLTGETAVLVREDVTQILPGTAISQSLTMTSGGIVGTPEFMAPEQCTGAAVDLRADIYSLGLITYGLLCGEPPFRAETSADFMTLHATETPVALDRREPSIPAHAARVVASALAKDPADRPQSAPAFAAALRANVEGELGLVRKARNVPLTFHGAFYGLLLCYLPAVLGAVVLAVAGHVAFVRGAIGATPVYVAVHVVFITSMLLCQRWAQAAGTLFLLREGPGRTRLFGALGTVLRGWRPILATQLRSLVDLRPSAFREHLLWPAVWAHEGLSGRAALERSAELTRAVPGVANALFVRQYGPAVLGPMIMPATFAVLGLPLRAYATIFLTSLSMVWSTAAAPISMTTLLCMYALTVPFLYWTARRCRGDGALEPEWEGAAQTRRRRRSARVRLSTVGWAVVPFAIVAFIAVATALRQRSDSLLDALDDGRVTRARALIDEGASIEARFAGNRTPLSMAVSNGYEEFARLLVERGADVNVRTMDGETPLMTAVRRNRPALVRLLLDHGATVDAINDDARTPLILAAMRGHADLVSTLLAAGADPAQRDAWRKSAADYAREERHAGIVAALEAARPRPRPGPATPAVH